MNSNDDVSNNNEIILLRTNSSESGFKTKISHFRASLIERGYPESLITATLSEIKFENRKQALLQKCKDDNLVLRYAIPTYFKIPRPFRTKGIDP